MKVQYLLADGEFKVHKAGCRDLARLLRRSDYDRPYDAEYKTEYEAIHDLYADQIAEQPGDAGEKATVGFLFDHGYVGAVDFAPCVGLTPLRRISDEEFEAIRSSNNKKGGKKMPPRTTTRTRPSRNGEAAEAEPVRVAPGRRAKPAAAPPPEETVSRRPRAKAAATTTKPATRSRRQAEPEAEPSTNGAAPKTDKRGAKQDLGRRMVWAIDDVIDGLPDDAYCLTAYDREELAQIAANMIHHFPAGLVEDSDERWWDTNVLPVPDRSDWK